MAIVVVVFGVLMWAWRQGAEWLVHTYGGWIALPFAVFILAAAWYAERKGWLT